MSYIEHKALFAKCEEVRSKPLITYVTSLRPNSSAQMAGDAIPQIITQVQAIPVEKDEVDFLIISNGGDPITALRIINILRERFKKISVLIPYAAFSAATILALGADEIIMHPYSNLGPVDPQLSVIKPNGIGQQSQVQFSSEDIRNYIEFIRSDVGITDQAHLITAFNSLAADVGPLPIGSSKRSQQLSLSLSTKMLEAHMDDKSKAAAIAKSLNTSYYHHGYALSRHEAKSIGLNIIEPKPELENILWDIWSYYCDEMKCDKEFNPIAELMDNPQARQLLTSIPVVNIPANTPPQIAQQLIANIAQQNAEITQQAPVEIISRLAAIESLRVAYNVNITHSIAYWRDANMNLSINVTSFSRGWEKLS